MFCLFFVLLFEVFYGSFIGFCWVFVVLYDVFSLQTSCSSCCCFDFFRSVSFVFQFPWTFPWSAAHWYKRPLFFSEQMSVLS